MTIEFGYPAWPGRAPGSAMAVYEYWWGTERPQLQEARYQRLADVFGQAARARLQAEFEARIAEVDCITASSNERVGLIRMSLVGGRYNRDVANAVAAQHGLLGSAGIEKRGRGRPRKYGPGDTRPARPSRAKTDAGRLRAMGKQFPKRGVREGSKVSPVTASPARSVAPQAAPAVGRELLVDTIAAKQNVAAAVDLVVTVSEEAIVASAPAVAEAPSFDPRAAAERLNNYRLAALREFTAGAEMTIDGEIIMAAYLQSHRRELHECAPDWVRGQDGAKRHDYDFTDAADAERVRPEIRALFKGFGLSRHEPTFDRNDPSLGMSEEDLQLWMKSYYFNGVDFPVADYDVYIRRYGSAHGFCWQRRSKFEEAVAEERERFWVWPFIERRLVSVERRADQVERGEIDLTTAKVRVMNDEVRFIGRLTWTEQAIYRKIVDAMTWFDGFSRLDLLAWAGDDPAKDRTCRIHQRFPAWAFPRELHQDVLDGWIFEEAGRYDYTPPTSDDLIAFAEKDEQGRIENLRNLSKLDFADIEL
ncbi:hypothetical protein [Bosea sp. 685]|uniref:hypothetical protein n=1 Tax=Bosea sp. 685 TaxID=3080057 RepID=UPI0028931411|nr:hypothetical protein [Bosea sp. 685]WNJ87947.1 hypothetical protein RMR04_00925 [Bosea sp. 685]